MCHEKESISLCILSGDSWLNGSGKQSSFNDDSLESSLELANVEALSDGENENEDCKLYLTRICTSGHVDHHFYRTVSE